MFNGKLKARIAELEAENRRLREGPPPVSRLSAPGISPRLVWFAAALERLDSGSAGFLKSAYERECDHRAIVEGMDRDHRKKVKDLRGEVLNAREAAEVAKSSASAAEVKLMSALEVNESLQKQLDGLRELAEKLGATEAQSAEATCGHALPECVPEPIEQ